MKKAASSDRLEDESRTTVYSEAYHVREGSKSTGNTESKRALVMTELLDYILLMKLPFVELWASVKHKDSKMMCKFPFSLQFS